VRCALSCGYPLSSAVGGAFRLGVAQPRAAPRRRGGRAQGGGRPRPSEFCAVVGRERASGPTRRAKWAKKWFALRHSAGMRGMYASTLSGTRSRQDESIEVGEVGSKRPSSGGNGGHVVSLYPLTWRSLESTCPPNQDFFRVVSFVLAIWAEYSCECAEMLDPERRVVLYDRTPPSRWPFWCFLVLGVFCG
jgi:hypothetical protein